MDYELLLKYCKTSKKIIVYDVYSTKYGLYDDICNFLIENNLNPEVINLTLPNTKIGHGSIDELLTNLNLDINSLNKYLGD